MEWQPCIWYVVQTARNILEWKSSSFQHVVFQSPGNIVSSCAHKIIPFCGRFIAQHQSERVSLLYCHNLFFFFFILSLALHSFCQNEISSEAVCRHCVLSRTSFVIVQHFRNYENEKKKNTVWVFTLWMTSNLKFNESYVVTRSFKPLKLLMIYQNDPLTEST